MGDRSIILIVFVLIIVGFLLAVLNDRFDVKDRKRGKNVNSYLITIIAGFISITAGLYVTNFSERAMDKTSTVNELDSIVNEITCVFIRDKNDTERSVTLYDEDVDLLKNALLNNVFISNISKESYTGLLKQHSSLVRCNLELKKIVENKPEDIDEKLAEKECYLYNIINYCDAEKNYILTQSKADPEIIQDNLDGTEWNEKVNLISLENAQKEKFYQRMYEVSSDEDLKKMSEYYKVLIKNSENEGSSRPSISISAPSKKEIAQGDSVEFRISFSNASSIHLKETDIGVAGDGVTLEKEIIDGNDPNTKIILLKNIKGPYDKLVSIAIREGVAENSNGATSQTPKSIGFRLKN